MWLVDTLANLFSGLGTAKDKTVGNVHFFAPRSPEEIRAAYRGNWIARKVVDIPAFDMLREWRSWQASDEQVAAIEAAEKALGLQTKMFSALKRARRDGGAALLIGDGAADPAQPLVPDRLPKGGIRYLTVLGRDEIATGEIDRDPASDFFGRPSSYRITGGSRGQQAIHPSRVVPLIGAPILDTVHASAEGGWGDSVLQAVFEAVDQATSSSAYVNAMLPEAKQDIISVPGLSNYLSTEAGTKALTDRFAYAARMKSMFGMLLLEGDGKSPEGEVFEQKQIAFTGLPDVVRLFLSIAAGAADIPATRLLGRSPDGQNSTGDSDTRNYYDRIASEQKVVLTPDIARLDELLIRHALGARPPEVWYEWRPLYQASATDKATAFKTVADAVVSIGGTALVHEDVLSKGVKGWLQDSGMLPGIDAAYAELGDAPLTEGDIDADQFDETGQPTEAFAGMGRVLPFRRITADAAPRTLYVSRKLKNGADLIAWAKGEGFTDLYPASELHVTIAYSRQPVDWMKLGQTWPEAELKVEAGGPRLVEPLGGQGLIVLMFASSDLQWRWRDIREAGASWDHDEYTPHVSFAFSAKGADLRQVHPYNGPLVFGPELFAEIDEGWKAGVARDGGGPNADAPFVEDAKGRIYRRDRRGRFSSGAADLAAAQAGAGKNAVIRALLGPVGRPGGISKATGVDVRGFGFVISNQKIAHILKNHGDAQREAARGQIAIGPADFSRLSKILRAPGTTALSKESGKHGEPRFEMSRVFEGARYEIVGEVQRGKRRIEIVTLFRRGP